MSQNIAFKRHLDDLYFNMLEYFNFEKEFIYNLPKNYISTYVICLVDAEEIENWKSINSYDSCLDFLENCDTINFEKFQIKLLNQKQNLQKNFRKKFVSYETLDEVCHSLKKGGRISVIGNQFLCYVNNTTYTKKCFKCYTKNNQLIIYFGSGKSIFIPKFFPDKILDSENVFIVDLPGDNNCFIEAIFDNNNRYQNMYESIKSCGSKIDKDLKMSMTNLLSYDVDKNEMKKFKNYNFYLNEEEKNNDFENNNKNINKQENIISVNNNNDLIYNYNNNYYINYADYGMKSNIDPNYIYSSNELQNYNDNYKLKEIEYNNININEYPRDTNENININYNNKYINEQNYIQEEVEKENINSNNNIENNEQEFIPQNEVKETDEQNNFIEIQNQNQEEPKKEVLYSIKVNNEEVIENKSNEEKEEKEENNKSNKYLESESQNQIEQEKETFYLNDLNNKETLLKQEKEEELKNKDKEDGNQYIESESQNQIDQEKEIFYINYINNQKINPELKDLEIQPKQDKGINKEKDFSIKNIEKFPILGLDNISGKNSYINSTLQCLSNSIPLITFFLSKKNLDEIISNNEDKKLLPSFLQILKNLWTNDNINTKSLNPERFINSLRQISTSFNKEEENDIGELIIFLLEQIYSEIQDNNKFKEDNVNMIYETFFGGEKELTSECLKCLNDNKEQNEVQKYVENKKLNYLMFRLNDVLDFLKYNKIKEDNNINIYDCLNFFESPKIVEQNGKVCSKCGNKEEFLITSKIKKCQNNLLILLNKNFNNEEKDEEIKFELSEIFEMKNFVKDNQNNEKLIYDLYAMICLNIKFEEKKQIIHHVAFCKSPVDGKWYKYDDNIVESVVNLEDEMSKIGMPVALFYQKKCMKKE